VALLSAPLSREPGDVDRPALFGASVRDILIARGYVTADEWEAAARQQPDDPETALVGRGRLTQLQVAEARALRWGLEWRRLEAPPDPTLAREAPDEIRARWPLAVLESTPEELVVAVSDPEPVQLRDALRDASRGRRLRLVVVPASDLPPAEEGGESEEAVQEIEADPARLRALGQDTFIVRLTTDIIERAIALGASDIHVARFDEGGTGCEARFRVDGQLQVPGVPIPRRALAGVVSRLLLLAGLDISQHRLPQSGKIPWPSAAAPRYDLRIETSPDARGEHAVVRVFTQAGIPTIEALGFTEDIARGLDQVSRLPHGLVLVCGRTGCGKSTTLAVLVRRIHALFPGKAIYTVEDPVEQAIPGIVQVPVDARAERTFPVLLRSALRKNPDVIMIGEIRDLETAQIAVQASLTGHLVLGTLHTNTAAAAIPRLINLGVPYYYVADVLRAVLSQRLVRATCRACGQPAPIPETLRKALPKLPETERVGRGCPACYQGYVGRLPIGELLVVDDEISARITAQATALEIQRLSRTPTLLENGIEQLRSGRTTASEVLREALWTNGVDKGQPTPSLPVAAAPRVAFAGNSEPITA
jgi:type II secretory ATPase GspE/PulE/Tfp pilus assembly ATPase PilB-like protein